MKITDLKSAIIGTNIVLRVMTDKGIDGYAEVESNKDFLQPLVPYFKSLILGCDPTDVASVMWRIRRGGGTGPGPDQPAGGGGATGAGPPAGVQHTAAKVSAVSRHIRRTRMLFPLGVLRKPAFGHALALFEQFADRPQRRGAPHGQQRRPEDVPHGDRTGDGGNSHHEEQPPDFHPEIVFALGDHRVKDADDQKGGDADDDSGEVVLR